MSEQELARADRRSGVVPLHPQTRFEKVLWTVIRGILVTFARLFFRLKVTHLERMPKGRAFILAPVHRSNLDFMITLAAYNGRMRYLAKDTLWKPGWGQLFSALGGIPVARGSADREALRQCIEVIESGEPLVMFPEGTRQFGPDVADLFDGPAFVQSRTGAPIVPVGIGGSADAMPKGSKMLRPVKIAMVIGDPIEAPEGWDGHSSKARRSAIREQTARLKVAVQDLFNEAQRNVNRL